MAYLGYQFLCGQLKLSTFELSRPARIAPVSRLTQTAEALLVPAQVAPDKPDTIEHLLFALKHEGINLQVLAQALKHLPAADLAKAVQTTPSGRYMRILGFLWEAFNQRELPGDLPIAGPTVDLFDTKHYITTPGERNARWRVNFNGLGSVRYCITIERTETINALLEENILEKARRFLANLGQQATDRALAWAYLHETESSFAIEHESPSQNKAEAFVALLKQAHQPRLIDEAYLVELQNAAINNPLDRAATYRHQQNWLRGPLRGVAGITYVPPPPEHIHELMHELLAFANQSAKTIDPLVVATTLSFGFVFIHPFMDGNGRLSRFLFHYALCQSGQLTNGLLLPVSIAMKRNEEGYLKALQSFSIPMRKHWDIRWMGDEQYQFQLRGDESLYRYWDATPCVEFGLHMAQQALEKDLREETEFLQRFDLVYRQIDGRFDVRGNELTTLILGCLQNHGKVSKNRRKQFQLSVPEHVFQAIEEACGQT